MITLDDLPRGVRELVQTLKDEVRAKHARVKELEAENKKLRRENRRLQTALERAPSFDPLIIQSID